MTLLYSDPYKDNKFGKIKGDKRDEYFKAVFDEARFYKHENSYILAGQFTAFFGVARAYKPELGLKPGLVEIPIYGSEYEIRQKKSHSESNKTEYESITLQPSIAEKLLYQHIEDNPSKYMLEDKAFNGSITLQPDLEYRDCETALCLQRVVNGLNLEVIEKSGNYPSWEAPKSYSKGSYGSYNKSASLEDKVTWLKTELKSTVLDSTLKSDDSFSIATYVRQITTENSSDEKFLAIYFNLINSIMK